jgi:hypothetical protein
VAYVRTVKTSSGAIAVQIVHSYHRRSREIEHSVQIQVGDKVLTAADPIPNDVLDVVTKIRAADPAH